MLLRSRLVFGTFAVGLIFLSLPSRITGQQPESTPPPDLPDAPQAQPAVPAGEAATQQPSAVATQSLAQLSPGFATAQSVLEAPSTFEFQSTPAQAPEQSSSSQAPAPPAAQEKTDREKAEEQLKAQEHQRVAGVMAAFNTTRNREALPLSAGQKFRLFFKSSTDPWPFFLNGITAGIGQATNTPKEWGQGAQGYARRFGGNYSDYFIGNFFGNAMLPSLLHEDPRYFQKGTGNPLARMGWAAASSFWCRRDNGKWGPNYANVGGNLIGAAIARAYYPDSERDVADTISDGLTVTVEGIAGAELIEFWPDIARRIKHKHDEKMARKAAQSGAQPAQPTPKSGDKN
jgi:hypothetical protein